MKVIILIIIALHAFFAAIAPAAAPAATADRFPLVTAYANNATPAKLEAVKGIGRELARRIIAARPHRTSADVRAVKGIGEKKMQALIEHTNKLNK